MDSENGLDGFRKILVKWIRWIWKKPGSLPSKVHLDEPRNKLLLDNSVLELLWTVHLQVSQGNQYPFIDLLWYLSILVKWIRWIPKKPGSLPGKVHSDELRNKLLLDKSVLKLLWYDQAHSLGKYILWFVYVAVYLCITLRDSASALKSTSWTYPLSRIPAFIENQSS